MFPMMGAGRASQRIEEEKARKNAERLMNDPHYANACAVKGLHEQGVPLRHIAKRLDLKQSEVKRLLTYAPERSPYAAKDD